jgi:hypothetical protein
MLPKLQILSLVCLVKTFSILAIEFAIHSKLSSTTRKEIASHDIDIVTYRNRHVSILSRIDIATYR